MAGSKSADAIISPIADAMVNPPGGWAAEAGVPQRSEVYAAMEFLFTSGSGAAMAILAYSSSDRADLHAHGHRRHFGRHFAVSERAMSMVYSVPLVVDAHP